MGCLSFCLFGELLFIGVLGSVLIRSQPVKHKRDMLDWEVCKPTVSIDGCEWFAVVVKNKQYRRCSQWLGKLSGLS